ncbi:GH23692, partial [Drosophila grimshawi]
SAVVFKLTNAVCESFNKSSVVVNQCRLRAVQRNKAVLNIEVNILVPAEYIEVRMQILRKGNGYKPWLFDVTLDACKFLRKSFNPAVTMVWALFKDFTNINHTCPLQGYTVLKDFYPRPEKLLNPFPTGEYLLIATFKFNHQRAISLKFYITYEEDFVSN